MVWVYLKITRTEKGKAFNLEAGKGIISLGKKKDPRLSLSLSLFYLRFALIILRKERERRRENIDL